MYWLSMVLHAVYFSLILMMRSILIHLGSCLPSLPKDKAALNDVVHCGKFQASFLWLTSPLVAWPLQPMPPCACSWGLMVSSWAVASSSPPILQSAHEPLWKQYLSAENPAYWHTRMDRFHLGLPECRLPTFFLSLLFFCIFLCFVCFGIPRNQRSTVGILIF